MRAIAFGHNLVLLLSLRSVIRTAMLSALSHSSNPGGQLLSFEPKLCVGGTLCFFLSPQENRFFPPDVCLKGCLICNWTGIAFAN